MSQNKSLAPPNRLSFNSEGTWVVNDLSSFFSGLGRLSQAEEYLSQAQWTILKTPDCSNSIKSKFYRILGLLYAAKGEYAESLQALAEDVYHASGEFGTEDIRTSGGYFHMANVFMQQEKQDVAFSLYEQV